MRCFNLFVIGLTLSIFSLAQNPVTRDAFSEAKEFLNYLYAIKGKYTLTSQHCQPLYKDILMERVKDLTGNYPAVYGQDFGFSPPNSLDGINFRQRIVDDAIAWYNKSAIITIMLYAGTPVFWRPYHEMNGSWFWWGARHSEEGRIKLYRILFDRLVNYQQKFTGRKRQYIP
ncbi:MAG: hypothetical protein JXB49_14605 [Bacteroidales bacterium]|nr:hypothetical protein [Bacteroidales bacterium]MBN2820491.1 hypothetical protein [Bacteroidales bacterium]